MGTSNSTLPLNIECSGCKAELRPQDKFCSNCGRPVAAGSDSPWADTESPDFMEILETHRLSMEDSIQIEEGDLYAGKFRIIKLLGAGGMGLVYLAQEESLDIKIALKILRPEFSRDTAAISRFQREVRVLARLRHPSIPRIIEWGNQNGAIFFAAEFIEGKDLAEILRERGAFSATEATSHIIAVAEALESAHHAGVVHRDLKPSNIMMGDDGRLHLIDFGVARVQSAEITRLTKSGLFIGTPQYMSPEQINSHYTDERSDIYSLGIVFYELLTGKLPFTGETPIAIAGKHQKEPPTPPRAITPSISFHLERVILRCLEKEPGSRYWTVNEFLTDVRRKHGVARVRRRVLPNGDSVTEDPAEQRGAPLVISSDHEKVGWGPRIAVYYRDQFFRVRNTRKPEKPGARWRYQLALWPENEIMPRVVDYEAEAAIQSATPSVVSRAKKWIKKHISVV